MNQEFLTYIRSLSKQDKKTLSQKALKTAEEVGELAKVVLPFDNAHATTHRFIEREQILEEAMDTVLCALSVAYDLDFTDEEVDAMLLHKAKKWAMLQNKERDLKYPLPFEIHVTVLLNKTDHELTAFRNAAKRIGVKPIVIDLQGKTGNTIMIDVMTSSKHFGDNRSALAEAQRIKNELELNIFNVTRVKIETVPWHPAAPKFIHEKMPPNCYFEAHIGVTLDSQDELERFHHTCSGHKQVHVSQNAFKRFENGQFVVMATYRTYDGNNETFNWNVANLVTILNNNKFVTEKPITEFAVYDTKISHDASWLLA